MDWFFHILGLKSPREMRELDRQFAHDMRQNELQLARAMAESLTGEQREMVMKQIDDAEKKAGGKNK
jgi:hypothetical protein